MEINENWYRYFDGASEIMLFASGITGVGVILFYVIKAHRMRSRMRVRLESVTAVDEASRERDGGSLLPRGICGRLSTFEKRMQ